MIYAKQLNGDLWVRAEEHRKAMKELTADNTRLRAALEEIKLRSVSLADAQVTALEALKGQQ